MADITIIDLNGRIVEKLTAYSRNEINVAQLNMATYLLEIKTENQVYKTRFIKN
jgi:hypothetical protein